MQLYPAILTESIEELSQQVATVQNESDLETIHIDIIDGFFADALTVTPIDLNEVELGETKVDLHLMVTEPLDFVFEAIASLEATRIRAMIGQIEQMSWQSEYLEEVKKHGWKTGLALNLYTPIEEIEDDSWSKLDVLLILGVEAGAQHLQFNPVILQKIQEVRAKLETLDHQIEILVDGGVNLSTIQSIVDAGADSVTAGSAIWTADEPGLMISELLNAAQSR